ncbi:hypothetical protein C8Q79DRAFT_941796 [Trametes meyenii]|nr:hypothetical protein C8Q79DRAFT_941796 [Trametes meyenii]
MVVGNSEKALLVRKVSVPIEDGATESALLYTAEPVPVAKVLLLTAVPVANTLLLTPVPVANTLLETAVPVANALLERRVLVAAEEGNSESKLLEATGSVTTDEDTDPIAAASPRPTKRAARTKLNMCIILSKGKLDGMRKSRRQGEAQEFTAVVLNLHCAVPHLYTRFERPNA